MEYLPEALSLISTPAVFAAALTGVIFGVIIGVLPGLGAVIALTLFLPFTFAMDQVPAIVLLLSLYAATIYGGSVTAILINTPGVPSSAATALDGFPLAKQGKAGLALGWATIASVFGGLFSVVVLIIAAPELANFAVRFTPIETTSMIILGLTTVAVVAKGSILKGLMAASLGLFLATIGSDPMTGITRFAFGNFQLSAGIGLVPVIVGLFALTEVFSRAGEKGESSTLDIAGNSGMFIPPWGEWRPRVWVLLKSSMIGTFVGALPGAGATIASFISYGEAKRSSPRKENFGKGEPDGIVASESANNAVTGGALVPTMALGIPGDAVTAIMMSTLLIHGISPGVRLFKDNPEVVFAAFLSLAVINLMLLVTGLLGARVFTKLLKAPEKLLMPAVLVLSIVGSYAVRHNMFDVAVAIVAGIVGFFLRRFGFPIAPVVIGMVLGGRFEENLRQALILTDGSFWPFLQRPISLTFLVLVLVFVLTPVLRKAIPMFHRNESVN